MDEAAFRDIISGDRRGLSAGVTRGALAGLSLFYSFGVSVRNRAFDRGWKKTHRAAVPVVSVGNITTGGTGKTPCVAYLVDRLRETGIRVVILSRGYRALPGQVNDEKLLLDRLCPGVPHLQHPDRVESAHVAAREHDAQLLILDDGFQHRRIARNLDIVLIDALNPFGYGHLLPRGLLREPLAGLRRADLIVLTRADQCSDDEKQRIIDRITGIRGSDTHVEVAFTPDCLVNAAGETADFQSLLGQQVGAFCGIGNPHAFAQTIADCGLRIADRSLLMHFPDHHRYTDDELTAIGQRAVRDELAALVTTQKDLVKINRTDLGGVPLWAIGIGTTVLSGDDLLTEKLTRIACGLAHP